MKALRDVQYKDYKFMAYIVPDIDECALNNQICGKNKCIDTKGSYECMRTRCPNQYFVKRTNT